MGLDAVFSFVFHFIWNLFSDLRGAPPSLHSLMRSLSFGLTGQITFLFGNWLYFIIKYLYKPWKFFSNYKSYNIAKFGLTSDADMPNFN